MVLGLICLNQNNTMTEHRKCICGCELIWNEARELWICPECDRGEDDVEKVGLGVEVVSEEPFCVPITHIQFNNQGALTFQLWDAGEKLRADQGFGE